MVEDGQGIGRSFPFGNLAFTIYVKRLLKDGCQIGAKPVHFIVD
jgi:hypothetical protein